MKHQLVRSSLLLLVSALVLTGCQQTSQQRKPAPAPAPVGQPAPAPAPKVGCTDPTWGLIRMTKVM
ncbi:MAG: hypothetical protein KJ070_00135, partial [Verrucomicrobia bacterium]|nr:hypothetical protein [Verrucomicrobiota bacterium]